MFTPIPKKDCRDLMNDFDMDEIMEFWESYFRGDLIDVSGPDVDVKEDW